MPKPARNIYCTVCGKYEKHYAKEMCSKCYSRHNYLKNKDRHSKRGKVNYRKNKEPVLKRSKEYYYKNKEYYNEKGRQWYKANKDKHNARAKIWAQNNREKRRASHRKWYKNSGRGYRKNKKTLAKRFGLKCQLRNEQRMFIGCGVQEDYPYDQLHIDHKWPVSLTDSYPGNDINEIANLQLVCQSCNSKKSNKLMM